MKTPGKRPFPRPQPYETHAAPIRAAAPMPVQVDPSAPNSSRRLVDSMLPWSGSVVLHLVILLLMVAFIWHHEQQPEPGAGGAIATTILPHQSVTPSFSSPDADLFEPHVRTPAPQYYRSSTPDLPRVVEMNPGGSSLELPSALVTSRGASPGGGRTLPAKSPGIFRPGAAARICFVVDQSGSMLETFDIVKAELKRSIIKLHSDQHFHVIFFAETPTEYPARRLLPATPLNKQSALGWIDGVVNQGQTDPQAALIRALALRPDKILFLTDGDFDEKLVTLLRRHNRHGIAIDTYAYLNHEGERLLRQISDDSGGVYTPISWQQLGR